MDTAIKSILENDLNTSIKKVTSLSGGDISKAYLLSTAGGRLFCKTNSSSEAKAIFLAEKEGLELISATKTIKTPEVYSINNLNAGAYILMEYIEGRSPQKEDWIAFGNQLKDLHNTTSGYFGLNKANFIGSLLQTNDQHKNWSSFYRQQRLMPQLRLALDEGRLTSSEIPSASKIENALSKHLGPKSASLLHGDLWSGNFLIDKNGTPFLIDPSVYYGDPLVDLAMTKLFGRFSPDFYQAYHQTTSIVKTNLAAEEIYQLYYLLVHLNLFGASYYPSVIHLLKKYFR